jgi:DNA-directed RNA polymerase
MFQPHPFLARLYDEAQLTKLIFEPKDMPSLVPPVPWFSYYCGGNLLNTSMLDQNIYLLLTLFLYVK